MQILIISDSHDNEKNIRFVLNKIDELEIDVLLHCGDLVDPSMFKLFEDISLPIYYVFGNNEGMTEDIIAECERLGITWYLDVGEFEIDGKKIAITHYPKVASSLATFGSFDLICFGHSHRKGKEKMKNGGWLVNPGTLGGVFHEPSFATYDTETNEAIIHELGIRQKSYHFE